MEFATVLDGGVREAGGFVGERRHAGSLRRPGQVGWAVGIDRPIRYHEASVGERLAMRNLLPELRDDGFVGANRVHQDVAIAWDRVLAKAT